MKEKEQYLLSVTNENADTVDKIMSRLDVQNMHEAPDDIAVMVLAGRV